MMKGQKGITLVALIITIIVMLILVGVSLSIALGENGLIARSKTAGAGYNESADAEQQGTQFDYNGKTGYNNVIDEATKTSTSTTPTASDGE